MKKRQQANKAALYLRLSRDDGGDAESNSISNQREILQRYAMESGFEVVGEYVDDGISGTTFERPSFKRMITDMEDGKIGIMLCKDLSRLGRNNALVSYYTEIYFMENDIRFIALNDNIDTLHDDNEIMPFKSVINEYYARDISKKVRSAFRAQAYKGLYFGPKAPYGYAKDPDDPHRLIPDTEVAPVLKRIFALAAEGNSSGAIARTLTKEKILCPSAYIEKNLKIKRRSSMYDEYKWDPKTIQCMLANRTYCGHMVSLKRKKKSFKSDQYICVPEDEHIVVLNTHEPLVSEEMFELVKKFRSTKKRPTQTGFNNIFQGLLKCADCGSGMALKFTDHRTSRTVGYNCCYNRKGACPTHYITYKNLYGVVHAGILDRWEFVKAHENELEEYANKLSKKTDDFEVKQAKTALSKAIKRRDELDTLIQRLFEQNAIGLLTNERFLKLATTYENEQTEVKEKIDKLQARISSDEKERQDVMRFFKLIRKYTEINELDAGILKHLIDNILVHTPSGRGSNRRQKITVNFKFIKDHWFSD